MGISASSGRSSTSASAGGAALLLTGEPGVGKTALLDAAQERAMAAGVRVLRPAGAQFEADVSFSGLNQVLLPLGEELAGLSAVQRDALKVAQGLTAGPPSDRLVVSNAALALLRQAAVTRLGRQTMTQDEADIVTKLSPLPVADTVSKLTGMISAKGIRLFAVIDQSARRARPGSRSARPRW